MLESTYVMNHEILIPQKSSRSSGGGIRYYLSRIDTVAVAGWSGVPVPSQPGGLREWNGAVRRGRMERGHHWRSKIQGNQNLCELHIWMNVDPVINVVHVNNRNTSQWRTQFKVSIVHFSITLCSTFSTSKESERVNYSKVQLNRQIMCGPCAGDGSLQ